MAPAVTSVRLSIWSVAVGGDAAGSDLQSCEDCDVSISSSRQEESGQ